MKRFLVFAFPDFYPSGGMSDFAGDFDTEAEALAHIDAHSGDHSWAGTQILDLEERSVTYDSVTKETLP